MEKLKVLELFSGIGACSKALERLGIDFEIVDSVEIDKYAVKSFNAIHNTTFEPQDICKWDKDIEVDLIMHGSPCQDFSLAGKQAGGDKGSGTRSSLMYETIRIVEKLKPKYVVWENVKNLLSKKHRHNFDAYLETMENLGYTNYYQVMNAKDYGIPQNRERVFTVSIRNDYVLRGTFWHGIDDNDYEPYFDFPPKQELKLQPIDMLENDVDEKYYLSENNIKTYQRDFGSKGKEINLHKPIPTLTSSMGTGGGNIPYFTFPPKQELKLKLKDILEDNVDEKYYLSDEQVEKIRCSTFHQNNRRIQEKEYCDTLCARDWKDPKCVVADYRYDEGLRIRKNGLSPCLTTKIGSPSLSGNTLLIKNNTKQGYLEATDGDGCYITNIDKKRGTVQKEMIPTLKTSPDIGCVTNNLRIRKLTPKETWRLMGFDDEDFEKAAKVNSNTQLYKQAGNSIVVNVLEAIFKNLLKDYLWSDLD